MSKERFILIPGLGADGRLFKPQRTAGLEFEVPELPIPEPEDDLKTYAAHIRDRIELTGPCVVGGVSFGGMLACELAAICQCRCVLVIASCRSRFGLRWAYHPIEWLSRMIPDSILRKRSTASCRWLAQLESLSQPQFELLRDMALATPIPFLRRAARMILKWRNPTPLNCPVHQIHGEKDRLIPLWRVRPDQIVPQGGHLINMTHAHTVNHFIHKHLATTPRDASM